MKTIIIDNFAGGLSRRSDGDLNSGLAKYDTTFGNDPFSDPGNLTWFEHPTSILTSNNAGIAAAKVRLESNTTFVYAIDNGAKLYKITVNDTSTLNPNYDRPSVIGAVPAESASTIGTLYGSSMQFYGATEKIFIGLDERIEKINFDGSGATKVTAVSSVQTNVPRPSAQFLGKMYWANGTNLIEIDSTETVTSYAKLSPGFPSGTFIRDLDVTPDGNYLQITVSRNNSPSLFQFNSDAQVVASTEAYKFYWNGTDTTYTAFETYNGYSLTSNVVYGQKNYTFGTDLNGTALYDGAMKIWTLPKISPPNFGASYSTGNLLGVATTEYTSSVTSATASVVGLQATGLFYGQYDDQVTTGLFRAFRQPPASVASGSQDIAFVPVCLPISNLAYTYQKAGYANNIIGSSKIYFSTTEIVPPASITFKFYKFTTAPTGVGQAIDGVYETQQQNFSKKIKIGNVRFYVEPLVANNSFKIDLIGSDGNPISGGTQTFTAGTTPVNVGDDYVWYTPQMNPTYSVGVRISNLGSVNWTGVKLELDLGEAGQ